MIVVLSNSTTVDVTGKRASDGSLVRFTRDRLQPGEKPKKIAGEVEGTVKVVRTYYYRKRAYELLTRMGVEVDKPNWTVE